MSKIAVKIRGFRGCERADVIIDPVALIGGLNYNGKTSIAEAVAAACCGTPIPFFKASKPDRALLTKADAKLLVRNGMDKGSAEVFLDGTVTCSALWPGLGWEGDGRLQCSKYAAGLISPMDLDDDERQKFFAGLLNAMPNQDDLRLALMETVPSLGDDKGGEVLKKLLDAVNISGYDPIHGQAKETGARLKGQWEAAAGEAYGAKKAAGWRPGTWRDDLNDKTIAEIGEECTNAEGRWHAAATALAIGEAAIEELQEGASKEAGAWDKLAEAEAALKDAVAAAGRQVKVFGSIRIPTATPCPHCGGLLDVEHDENPAAVRLKIAEIGAEEIQALISERGAEGRKLDELRDIVKKCEADVKGAQLAYAPIKGSAEKLAEAKKRRGTQEAVDLAMDALNGLKRDKAMLESVANASRLHRLIADNQKIVDVLAPEGLRRQKLVKALATFNQKFLATLCANAEYPAVTLDNDLEILYGGRRYFLLSKSEKYRVQAVLQLAIAMYDKSPLVIYDGADILDAPGRNGLFNMMASAEGTNFLVCMTVASREKLPNLAKAGMGESVWIEEGISYPLTEVKNAA